MSASGAHAATLSYDPLGRLWQVAAPSGTTRFVYDGDHIAIEYDGAGALLRAYVWGPGADEPLFWYEATGGALRRYFHADHQGSIVGVSDQWGNPLAVTGYDVWGIPNAGGVGFTLGAVGRFGHTGQAWLPELGLYYYKARVYSPTLGRFLQADPVGYDGGVNLYDYAHGDPLNHVDPSGENPLALVAIGAVRCAAHSGCRTLAIGVGRWIIRRVIANSIPPALQGGYGTVIERGDCGTIVHTEQNEEQPGRPERARERRARQRAEEGERRARRMGVSPMERAPHGTMTFRIADLSISRDL